MTAPVGLARFVPRWSRASVAPSDAPQGAPPARGERCELCAQPLPEEHSHLVELTTRALRCSCRACYFLFTPEGAGSGRYRPVPEWYLHDPAFRLTAAEWDALAIPVGVVFVFQHSDAGQPVAFYPSPAGATESLLPLDTWAQIMQANPGLAGVMPDVEAILLRQVDDTVHGYLVPIDACYDLVGRVRLYWRGFSGGEEVWREIDAFFDRLTSRADSVAAGAADG